MEEDLSSTNGAALADTAPVEGAALAATALTEGAASDDHYLEEDLSSTNGAAIAAPVEGAALTATALAEGAAFSSSLNNCLTIESGDRRGLLPRLRVGCTGVEGAAAGASAGVGSGAGLNARASGARRASDDPNTGFSEK